MRTHVYARAYVRAYARAYGMRTHVHVHAYACACVRTRYFPYESKNKCSLVALRSNYCATRTCKYSDLYYGAFPIDTHVYGLYQHWPIIRVTDTDDAFNFLSLILVSDRATSHYPEKTSVNIDDGFVKFHFLGIYNS